MRLMQDWPMTLDRILEHAYRWHGDQEVVTRTPEGPITRASYAEIYRRAKRLSSALAELGVRAGDRVATLAWNTQRHLEAWYAIMGMGAVCHTVNPRLFVDQIVYIVNHAEDILIFSDISFVPLLKEIRERIPSTRHIVLMTDRSTFARCDLDGALCFEDLIDQAAGDAPWGGFDENYPAGLCYTSGTTGNPKGVLYSHRSNFIHTLVTLAPDVLGLGARDSILPVVPMYHANAWGLAFSAPAVGAKLVMPGSQLDGRSLYELIADEQVTFSAAVPTVWQSLLDYMHGAQRQLDTLRRVVIGGAAVPESVVRRFRDEHGIEITHAWGMTEMSPLGTVGSPTRRTDRLTGDERIKQTLKQGRPPLGVDLKITDEAGAAQPHDGQATGYLKARGPFVVAHYYCAEDQELLDQEGYFSTGDIASIDRDGFIRITDRAKDVIKSGGEWISSIEIESITSRHPAVDSCAVIAIPHVKWGERPLLVVKKRPGMTLDQQTMKDFLKDRIASWWMPERVEFVADIPLGPTGKIDKKLLREQFQTAAPASAKPE
ncbi:MAG TPA: long-chain-fatty-acid--CoA ligase [Steroidobacter sp.]|uniref:long-chain-fatty-acid--CoA ligase n=1 Tax=Steroidobacter sp. TaxID=1978227 RepID=UPI002EDA429A